MSLHCQRLGEGPDLVVLHGWGLHSGIWDGVAERLAERFRVHLIDLPGHGHSTAAADLAFDDACDRLVEVAPTEAHWLGWSLGGLLALGVAMRFPARVARLVLVASNPRFVAGPDWPTAMRPEILDGFGRDMLRDPRATLTRFLSLVARGAPDGTVLRRLRAALQAAPPPAAEALRGGLAILRDADLRPTLDTLAAPALWLGGARDTLVPIEALRAVVAQHPALHLQEFAEAGHAPFVSHPVEFVAAVQEFLS